MDMQGDVEIDEAGNFVVAGQPIITSDAMSTPPSLRKRVEMYSSDDFLSKVKLGTKKYENESGVTTITPNDAMGLVTMRYKVLEPRKQSDLLTAYVMSKYGVDRDEVSRMDADMLAVEEGDMLKEYADIILQETNTATTREKEGGSGLFGVDNYKVTVTPMPLGEYSVGEGDAAVKSELYGFSTKPITWVGDESKDKGVSYFVDAVQFDEAGNMIVSGYKSVGSIEAAVMGMAMGEIEAGVDVREVLKKYNIKTEPLTQKKLSESEASSFSSSLKDKHKALAPLKTVAQIRDWTADYVGYSPKSKEEVTEGGQSSGGAMSGFNKGN
jgi:hypothetical protein